MFKHLRYLIIFTSVLLTACASNNKAPVQGGDYEPKYSSTVITPQDGVAIKPQQKRAEVVPKKTTKKARHETKIGVVKLLASAETYRTKNQLARAQSTLERAQRIDPKEPKVYYELAVVHLRKNQPRQAEQMSKKGLSLAHGNPTLQKELWTVMAKALQAQGKKKKAQKALQRAYKIKV